MATKPKTAEVPEGFTDTTKTEPIPEVVSETPAAPTPDPAPSKPAEQVAGYRPLNADEVRRINAIKQHFGDTIDYLKTLRDAYHDAEVQRMFAVAITNAETASMWAVRAITHRG